MATVSMNGKHIPLSIYVENDQFFLTVTAEVLF